MCAQIINRPTMCAPDAAPPQEHFVARWQRGAGRAHLPGVGAVARPVAAPAQSRTLEGPLCVRMVYALSNVRRRLAGPALHARTEMDTFAHSSALPRTHVC